MAFVAERVVTELIVDDGQFTSRTRAAAQGFDRSMSDIERSANRAEGAVRSSSREIVRSFDQTSMRTRQLGFQISDIGTQLAAGTSPFLILAQQGPQVANAMDGAGGAVGRFATILSGPWGAAGLIAVAILGDIILRSRQSGEAMDDASERVARNARQTELNRQAQEAYARTLPGIIAAIREQTAALDAQNRSLAQNQQLALDGARRNLGDLERQRTENIAAVIRQERRLADAEAALNRLRAGGERGLGGVVTNVEQERAELQRLRLVRSTLEAGIRDAQGAIRATQIPMAEREAEALSDPIEAIRQRYQGLRDAAVEAARGNDALTASLSRTIAALNTRRDREITAAQERQRESSRVERTLTRPVTGALLSPFGADRSGVPINGGLVSGRRHQGVDLRGNIGDPVVAPEGGIATVRNARGGLGLYVEIRADSGARSLLGHLSAANVQSGDRVTAGQLVGLVGNSGNARGGAPHLHWQRQVGGRWVDPMRGVGASGAAQAAMAAAREPSAQERRDRYEFEEFVRRLDDVDPIELLSPDDILRLGEAETMVAAILAAAEEAPALMQSLLPPEDQERLEDFTRSFQRDLIGSLVEAAAQGENLGDVLVRSLQRAASELITSGLMDLLAGRRPDNTLLGNLLGFGRVVTGGKIEPKGFATGGSMILGGYGGIDQNLLSLNGQPIGMVSRGEGLTITPQGRHPGASAGRASAARAGGSTPIIVTINAQDAVLTHTVRAWVAEGIITATRAGASQGATAVTRNAIRARDRAIP